MDDVRRGELKDISERLGRIQDFPLARVWVGAGTLLAGALIGGVVALVPWLSTTPRPDEASQRIYVCILGVVLLLAITCAIAAWTTHRERSESVSSIKRSFDAFMDSYEFNDDADPGA